MKFGDFEKEFIAKNRVDTTFVIAKNPTAKCKYGELVYALNGDTRDFFKWKFMDVGFVVYDSLGRLIINESMRWRDYRYFYDSLGILDSVVYRDWDVRPKYSSPMNSIPTAWCCFKNGLIEVTFIIFADSNSMTKEN